MTDSIPITHDEPRDSTRPAEEEPTSLSSTDESPNAPTRDMGAAVTVAPWKLHVILVGLIFCIFCVALDNTIVVTAIPVITDEFKALNDVGWYGSAFILPSAALVPLFGKIYAVTNVKWTFMFALFWFEVGSLICAVAPTSPAFIAGRAVAGAGSAGLFSGALIMIGMLTTMEKRPAFQSLIGGTYAIATIVAPLIGGAFTDNVSWRWCFYINLPIGGLGAALLLPPRILTLPTPSRSNKTRKEKFWDMDPIGQILFIPSVVCVLLALQWGGTVDPWSSGRIIALFVVFGILLIAFIGVQIWMGDQASIPSRVISQRTVAAVSVFSFLNFAQFFLFVYAIPVYFQAVKGDSAEGSGIHTIPMILPNNLANLFAGFMTTKYGHYVHFFFGCSFFTALGNGLMTTWGVNTSTGKWIGYQILAGIGTGLATSLPQVAVQPVLRPQDIPVGISTTLFLQFFGGALFVSVGSSVLNTKLITNIAAIGIPNFDAQSVIDMGATEFRRVVPPQYLPQVLEAYMGALTWVFRAGLILSCLSVIPACFLEWRSVKVPATFPEDNASGRDGEKQ